MDFTRSHSESVWHNIYKWHRSQHCTWTFLFFSQFTTIELECQLVKLSILCHFLHWNDTSNWQLKFGYQSPIRMYLLYNDQMLCPSPTHKFCSQHNALGNTQYPSYSLGGGSPKHGLFTMHELYKYHFKDKALKSSDHSVDSVLKFVDYGIVVDVRVKYSSDRDIIMADCPIQLIAGRLPQKHINLIANITKFSLLPTIR